MATRAGQFYAFFAGLDTRKTTPHPAEALHRISWNRKVQETPQFVKHTDTEAKMSEVYRWLLMIALSFTCVGPSQGITAQMTEVPTIPSINNTTDYDDYYSDYYQSSPECKVGEKVQDIELPVDLLLTLPAPENETMLPRWEKAIKTFTYGIAMTMGVLGNSCIILIMAYNRHMRSVTNLFVVNLAASDLMVSAFCMWIHLCNQIYPQWPFGPFICKANTFVQGNRDRC